MAWVDEADPSKPAQVLLVAEVAGAGKTALAHSIGHRCQERGVLKTSFFFRRDSAELSTPVKLITTLARDLSSDSGAFAQRVCDIIDKERSLASNFSYRQFEELILKPSSVLPMDKPLVIIIDALDECAERLDMNILLNILQDGVPQLPGMFRFLVTSRPTPDVDEDLTRHPHVLRQSLDLHERSNLSDIHKYVSHSLVKIFKGKEPDAGLVEDFSVATEGLFIWAFTVVAHLSRAFAPESALRRILEKHHPEQLPTDTKMNLLYTDIMERHYWDDPDFVQAYQAVMGMVLAAKEPLPISVLAALNPGTSLETFAAVLQQLHAVLHYEPMKPIRVLHKSFHDFLVTCSPDRPYYINVIDHEEQMAIFCLDILNKRLKMPIPGTGYLVDNTSQSKGIPYISNESVSEELWYSCQFWMDHCISMSVMSAPSTVTAAIQELIERNFVQWTEICTSKSSFTGLSHHFLTWLKVSLLWWITFVYLMFQSLCYQVCRKWYIQFLIYKHCHFCRGD